jgi:hypothetical protein
MQSVLFVSLIREIASLSRWPLDWAHSLLQRQAFVHRKALALVERPSSDTVASLADAVRDWHASGAAAAFDLARACYATGVQAGHIERSLLASGAFERRLKRLERLTLGPWARTV